MSVILLGIALEMQSLDCNGVYCASASLNASVPLGSRHGVAGPALTPVDAGASANPVTIMTLLYAIMTVS